MRLLALLLTMAAVMHAASQTQPQKRLSFEVASVKPLDIPPLPVPLASAIHISGKNVSTRGSVLSLTMAAYSLSRLQISSAPDWVQKQPYDINAKAEVVPSAEDACQMLLTLLEDRFQLKTHWETREMPVYNLVVAKSGPKMKPSEDQTPPPPVVVPNTGQRGFSFDPSGKQVRGTFALRQTPNGIMQSWSAAPMSVVVSYMQVQADRLVIDKTNLKGLFDVEIEFRSDSAPLGGAAPIGELT